MNKPYIVGIAGGSGSGKTFFLNCLLTHFKNNEVSMLSQDDYYFPVADNMTKKENRLYNFDLPSAIDHQQFQSDIRKLINNEIIYKKEYTFNNPQLVPKLLEIKPAPLLIVEGLFIAHFREIADVLDFKVFIEADDDIALKRRLKRDLQERGYSHDDVVYKWLNHVKPAYEEFLLPYKNECDMVISNNNHEGDNIIQITNGIANSLREKILLEN